MRIALLAILLLLVAPIASAAEILVHAASSLADVLREIADVHEARSGVKVRISLGGSNALARQIREGAPGDVFFPADEARMDEVERAGLLVAGTRVKLLSNVLVVVVPKDAPATIASSADLAGPGVTSIALADPAAVPAGMYAREHFRRIGAWSRILPKVVPCENVRAALAAVESGNVQAAVVYRTDARIARRVRVACEIPASAAPEISYPAAVLASTTDAAAARAFLARLASPEARAIFERHGFIVR